MNKSRRAEMTTSEIDGRVIRAVCKSEKELSLLVRGIACDAWPNGPLRESEYNALVCGLRTHLADMVAQNLPEYTGE